MASINEISDTIIDRINEAVRSNKSLTRTELSREVCRWLGWKSRNGQLQDMSCRKILAQLHQTGKILLPESQTHVNFRTKPKYEINEELPAIHNDINVDLDALGEIKLILVSGNTK